MRYSIGDSKNFEQFKFLIDNKYYIFRAMLFNADSAVTFTKTAIKELSLSDSVFNFYVDGYVIIDNTDDVIERYVSDKAEKELNPNSEVNYGFKMRGDGRDILHLTIIPLLDGEIPYNLAGDKMNELYGLNYYFALTNETNIPSETGKLKRYDITDIDYEVLKERKVFFTTSNIIKNVNASQSSDFDRQAYTGDCIKQVLRDALNDPTVVTSISGVSPNFDTGVNKIFFSSSADMTAMDSIDYLLQMHVTGDNSSDCPLFKKDSFTGEFTLRSISDLFKNAYIKKGDLDTGGAEFLENFNITGAQDSNQVTVNDIKKPNLTLELGDMSDVLDVNFYNVPADLYTERVKTKIVHAYDFNNKEFIIDAIDGDIVSVKDDFAFNYVRPLKGKDQKPYPSFINNTLKSTNQIYEDIFSIYSNPSSLLSQGRNKLLFNALILNMGVEITVKGSLSRGGGKFFSIDRRGSYIDNTFDNKFLGIYFIIDVQHTFKDNTYLNKITAVKTYHFTDPKISENVT